MVKGRSGHRHLAVWQKSNDLVEAIYRATAEFPKAEVYGLSAQMRRAAVSVPANIAEGAGRWGAAEFQRFLSIARGSLGELEALVELSLRLSYVTPAVANQLLSQIDEIGRMLVGLRRSLSAAPPPTSET